MITLQKSIRSFCGIVLWLSVAGLTEVSAQTKDSRSEALSNLLQKADQLNLANDPQWIRLLHYKKTLLHNWDAQVKNDEFYFNPATGKQNPGDELRGMIESLNALGTSQQPFVEEQNAFCRFPARVKWLKSKLPEIGELWKIPTCPRFEKYLEALRGESVSLVFSSYYLNSPSSAFGHTFLRINRKAARDGRRYELLDYGINFAANQDTNNVLLYAYKGLTGGFKGTFTSMPYYFKVREYNNSESRDLWEYELDVDPQTVEFFIAHLWEIGPATIYYYYLTDNCSYFVLSALEAADPKLDLTSKLKTYVIPSDTIQVVWNTPGLVKRFNYRPSIRTELQERLKGLDAAEKAEVLDIVENRRLGANDRSAESNRKILDAAIDSIDYRYPFEVQKESEETQFKNQLLQARSQIPLVTPPLKIVPEKLAYPHLSHPSRRLNLGTSFRNRDGNFFNLGYKFALHDQLDPVQGYPEYAEITFFDTQLSYSQKLGKLELEKFSMVEVLSSTTWDAFEPHKSWRMRIGVDRLRTADWAYCHAGVFELGGGFTSDVGLDDFTFFGGLRASANYMPACGDHGFIGLGPNIRARYRWNPYLISLAEAYWRHDFEQNQKSYRELSLATQYSFSQRNGLRLQLTEKGFEQLAGIEWVYYH